MSGTRSRNKGARGEREAARYLTALGFDCCRNGRNGISTGDLHGLEKCLPGVHIEVKFGHQSMDIHTADLRKAWEQARAEVQHTCCECSCDKPCWDCTGDLMGTPAVLWKPLRKPWRLTWMDKCGLVTTTGDDAIKAQLIALAAPALLSAHARADAAEVEVGWLMAEVEAMREALRGLIALIEQRANVQDGYRELHDGTYTETKGRVHVAVIRDEELSEARAAAEAARGGGK